MKIILSEATGTCAHQRMILGVSSELSRVGGIQQVSRHTGATLWELAAERDEGCELVGLIRRLAAEVGPRERLGRNAAETARKFTWNANAEALKRLFECVLERQRRRAPACAPPQ